MSQPEKQVITVELCRTVERGGQSIVFGVARDQDGGGWLAMAQIHVPCDGTDDHDTCGIADTFQAENPFDTKAQAVAEADRMADSLTTGRN